MHVLLAAGGCWLPSALGLECISGVMVEIDMSEATLRGSLPAGIVDLCSGHGVAGWLGKDGEKKKLCNTCEVM